MSKIAQNTWTYINDRFKLDGPIEFFKHKTVPEHKHSFWYYFGGIALFLTGLQIATGIMLLLYYTPSIDAAHESIQFIMSSVKFGWLIRSVHSWSANILVGILFVHMFSTFFLKSYRKPRELTWISGFFLFILFLAFGFSGYLLPWNELSYAATRVGTDIAGSLPLIGGWLKGVILGGSGITQATLSRFFWFHVALLPLAAVAIIAVHIWLVQILGMSRPVGMKDVKLREEPFFWNFVAKDALGWTIILVLVGVLCVFLPWEIGKKADAFAATPMGIKPEWYFTFMFTTLKLIPAHILGIEGEKLAIMAFMAGGLFWMLAPFLDRRAAQERKSPVFTWVGIIIAVYIVVLTIMTYTVKTL